MNIQNLYKIVRFPFRKRRMEKFLTTFVINKSDRILDVGGTVDNWEFIDCYNDIVLLNILKPSNQKESLPRNISFVLGDGTSLPYGDKIFDIVFSNSVIEHVGNAEKQKLLAKEVLRVGKRVWVQTPAKEFFFELHYLTPFIHWFPKEFQKKILKNLSLWGLIVRPSQKYIDDFVEKTKLVTFKELQTLFPGCKIIKEKFLFMTKSYIVIRL